jgi:hypothetical protein
VGGFSSPRAPVFRLAMAVDFADRADICQVLGSCSDLVALYLACRLVLVDSTFSTAGPSDNKSLSSVKLVFAKCFQR